MVWPSARRTRAGGTLYPDPFISPISSTPSARCRTAGFGPACSVVAVIRQRQPADVPPVPPPLAVPLAAPVPLVAPPVVAPVVPSLPWAMLDVWSESAV